MTDDLLTRLSDVELTTPTPALASIERRAATLRRARRARRISLTAVIGAAAASALVLGPVLEGPRGGMPPSSAQAVEVMVAAGDAAAQQPAPGEAAYWHVVSEYVSSTLSPDTQRREIWIGNDRPSVLIDTGANLEDGVDPGAARTLDSPGRWFLAGDWSGFADLPTDPDELERALRAELSPQNVDDLEQQLFEKVRELLTESPAPPAVRGALWQVLAGVPGVTYVGPTTDSAGRPGVALARDGIELIVDPNSGALLEQVHTTPPSEAAPEGTTHRETVLDQGPVDVAPVP